MPRWTSSPITLAATLLAAARLTRLATRDDLPPLETGRRRLEDQLPDQWAHGPRCAWCASIWTALAAVAAAEAADRAGHQRTWLLACLPLAISHVVGTLADREPT